MTEQEINIAIAESVGWKWKQYESLKSRIVEGAPKPYGWFDPAGKIRAYCLNLDGKGIESRCLPSYPTDLNAMHEVEKTLSINKKREMYRKHLVNICGSPLMPHATALQRAEAYLRTIGKWKGA